MIYIGILVVLALCALLFDLGKVRSGRIITYWGIYIMLVCLAGFRYKVGGDTYNYMYMHEYIPDLSNLFATEIGIEKLQPLWLLFSAAAKSIGDDFYILQILHAIVVNWVIFKFIKKNTVYRYTGVLFYYLAIYPFFNFEILRESLAVCCFLVAIPYYMSRKWVMYYLLATAAILFHASAVFLYLLPFVRNINMKPVILIAIFISSAILNSLFIEIMLPVAARIFDINIFPYEEYNYTILGLVSLLALYLCIPLLLAWAIDNKLKLELKYSAVCNKWLLISSLLPLLFIFYRLFNYFVILWMLMACEVAHAVIKDKKARKIRILIVPIFFSIAVIFSTIRYFKDTSSIIPSTRWYIRWQPYHSIFDPITVPERDRMISIDRMGSQ